MGGIGATLNIAQNALFAQQYGINVTGNNIANVNNPDYSRQSLQQTTSLSVNYVGFLMGTGVSLEDVSQSVNQYLEDRLTDQKAQLSAYEEAESYMKIIESFFSKDSESSLNTLMIDFWNSWQDLADNPQGATERMAVLEKGEKLSQRFNLASTYFDTMINDLNNELTAGVAQINSLTERIADLNLEIVRAEGVSRANDLRDQRNGLVDQLGKLIDVETYEQPNGTLIVNTIKGLDLVHGVDANELFLQGDQVYWSGTMDSKMDITELITKGQLGGWLTIRDGIIPEFKSEVDELANGLIWAMNYQHSQGSGLEYYSDGVTGTYQADDSNLLTSFDFGDKIDFNQAFTMWIQDQTSLEPEYTKVEVDMGISEAVLSDWQGTAPGGIESQYRLTVVDGATIGDFIVSETDGTGLTSSWGSTSTVSTALNSAIAAQTLTVYGSSEGTKVINVSDAGGDASRSAASIAQALNEIPGITAYASSNTATLDITNINNAQEGDEIRYSLYVDGVIHEQSFVVDLDQGSLQEQFEDSLRAAADAVNAIHDDKDLSAASLTLTSDSGRTIGIQEFEVQDNSGVRLDNFSNYDEGDTVTFTVASSGTVDSPATTTTVSVELSGVVDTDPAQMSAVFYSAMAEALENKPFTVELDPSTNSVVLRTTDGSSLTVSNGTGDSGNDASFDLSDLAGSAVDSTFLFNGASTQTYGPDASTGDTIDFIVPGSATPVTVVEDSALAGNKAAVVAATLTMLLEPDMKIISDVPGTGGLFDGSSAKLGSSIITLGGDGGFSGFSDEVSFDVDGITVTYDVLAAGHTTELEFAAGLKAALETAFLAEPDYQVIQTGKSVSILKNTDLDDPIEITNFSETAGNDATLAVSTGTGTGAQDPVSDLLEAGNDSSTSTLYSDTGIIQWEKYDLNGFATGEKGFITVEDEGRVSIVEDGTETLSFQISSGRLVAGNTLTMNTDTQGNPDPLTMTVKGRANSILDTYTFEVISGGKVGIVPQPGDDPLTIQWTNGRDSGTFEIDSDDPPLTPEVPSEIWVDGMLLKFYDGTLRSGDVFTITTDDTGKPVSETLDGEQTGEFLSDWHWTLDSFADQFNRQASGMKATTTTDNRLQFLAREDYYAMKNIGYSGTNGFSEENAQIIVNDWSSLNFSAVDFRFVKSSGTWGVANDPTGGKVSFIPEDGDDDGFGVDLTGDGIADLEIRFSERVSGDGSIEFDLVKHDSDDIRFAFSDDAAHDSGLAAAMGINTFFTGTGAYDIKINEALSDVKYIAATAINSSTGEISKGDNSNAIAMADVQFQNFTMKQWDYTRGQDARSSRIETTLDGYFNAMLGALGIEARSIQNNREFSAMMVSDITEQRDSLSAVSLDEEMIKLIKYQHAYSAAAKLITISDEMLTTLLSMR